MTNSAASATLSAETTARLAEFARSCKAAARAVSLYPGQHPAIRTTLDRLAEATGRLTEGGPLDLQVRQHTLLLGNAAPAKADQAVSELADLLHRHLIGALTVNPGAAAASWRTLLLLLARSPEDVRADGGIARLWATAGGPSLEPARPRLPGTRAGAQDRQRQLLALAHDEVAASALGQGASFDELWQRVESMFTSYSDEKFVSAGLRARAAQRADAADRRRANERRPARARGRLAPDGERRRAPDARPPAPPGPARHRGGRRPLARHRRDRRRTRRRPGARRLLRPGAGAGRRWS
jgi:hypothetical protein